MTDDTTTDRTVGALSPFATPSDALTAQAAARGQEDGLVFPMSGGSMSFAAWDAAATNLARGQADLGLAPGDRLALLAENRIEWPVVQIAACRAGLVLVPLNTHSGRTIWPQRRFTNGLLTVQRQSLIRHR